jgi:hypothetical protein
MALPTKRGPPRHLSGVVCRHGRPIQLNFALKLPTFSRSEALAPEFLASWPGLSRPSTQHRFSDGSELASVAGKA